MTAPTMSIDDACTALRESRGDALAVLTMSAIAYWPDPRPDDYRLMGLMGGAASIGLGIALGRPDRDVLVVDGDGSLLMQLGVLGAVAGAAPRNLVHVVVDNAIYAISGGQPMPSATDWEGLMVAAGYASATTCATPDDVRAAVLAGGPGPRGIVVRCRAERPQYPVGVFAISPADEAQRMRRTLATV